MLGKSDAGSGRKASPKRVDPASSAPAEAADPPARRGRRADLDDADRRLIGLLTEQGRLSNRALASEVGLTEATVASRLRSLSERGILAVTASLDWRVAGFGWDMWLEIHVTEGHRVLDVGAELATINRVQAVAVVMGDFDLMVHLLLPDRSDAVDFIAERIATVAGVGEIRPSVTLDTVKFETRHARMPLPPVPLEFPNPAIPLDELDLALIDLLVADGRQSNREAARRLDVSEGTVRVRLRRMEEAGLLRITARSDPLLTGEVAAWAFVGIDVAGAAAGDVARQVAMVPESVIVTLIAGSHDILAGVATRTRGRLVDVVLDEIRAIPGVRATATCEVVHSAGLNYQWCRLLD